MKAPQKLLKSNTDLGHQYIDFVQMFEKKMKSVTINSNSHKHLLNEYRSLRFNHHPISFYDSEDLTVYGSFENSNIHAVSQESTEQLLEMNVLLSSDTNTNGCTQWFYFGIKCHNPQRIKIRILNNRRGKSLLTKNNHIHVFDEGKWKTDCVQDLYYYRTNINHPFYHHEDSQIANLQTNISLYTLEFTYNFKQSDSIVYFALALPYTVKKLYKFLDTCTLKRKSICQTQLGLPVFRLKTKIKTQEVIVILARQHPSETVSSWICQELIRLLQQGHAIQEKYRFIIYPMVNPDGVFIGNSRCNFNGLDLNRKWDYPNQSTEPEVFYIAKQLKKYKIAFLLDLHGHSKKQNQFIYGCTNQIKHISDYMRVKQFSKLMAQNNQIFNYKDCSFSVTSDKFSTARIAMWKKLKIPNSMTIETSLYGYNNKPFQTHDFQSMALNILNSLSKFDATAGDQHLFDATEINRALTLIKKDIFEEKDKESGSDSEAEQDIVIHRPSRMKVTSRRDSTPTHIKYHKVLSKPKIPEAPVIQHQPSVFFRSNEHTYSFKRIPNKKVQVQKMQKIRSRMNSFQSQFIEEQPPLPNIHLAPRTNIKGAIDLIQAIQVKSLFK